MQCLQKDVVRNEHSYCCHKRLYVPEQIQTMTLISHKTMCMLLTSQIQNILG